VNGSSAPQLADAHASNDWWTYEPSIAARASRAKDTPILHEPSNAASTRSSDPASVIVPAGPLARAFARGWVRGALVLVLLAGYAVAALIFLPERIRIGYAAADSAKAAALLAARAADSAAADSAADSVAADSSMLVARTGTALGAVATFGAAPAPVVDSAALEDAAIRRFAHGPLARVLARRAYGGTESSGRIASALVREARKLNLAPSLLAAVLITENPHLDTNTVSSQGAMGLMQVMPFHAGEMGCARGELLDIDNNICHGVRIFGQYLKRSHGDTRTALLRYNGCVRSTNTPRCHRYPDQVMRLARSVRQQLLRYSTLAKQTGRPAAAPETGAAPKTPAVSAAPIARSAMAEPEVHDTGAARLAQGGR
jgi:soluble lytic murein transglycosylase-like protein